MRLRILLAMATLAVVAVGVSSSPAGATTQCASGLSITNSGTLVTATFVVTAPNCEVSLMGISYFGGPTTVVDTATGTFGVGTQQLQVHLPCGTNTEADLVLGPPALFPPPPYDLGAVAFLIGCPSPLTQGYWKNHASAWPVQTLSLGGASFTQAQAIALLTTPPAGNATLILVHQLIAAKLNLAARGTPTCVSATVAAADDWLSANGGAGGSVPAGSPAGQTAVALSQTLDSYNNGQLC